MANPMPILPPLRGEDRGVDAHQLAAQIHQRAAGVAGIDGGVGLNEILVAVRVDAGAAERADDPAVTVCCRPNGLPMATT